MRHLLISIAAALALALPAHAADKAGPPATFEQIVAARANSTACYVETSVTGVFLRDTREAQAGAGFGCEAKLFNLLIGGGLRADLSDWQNTGSIYMKLGVAINSGVNLYGLAEWKVPEWKVKDAGQLALGAGTEIKLELINPGLWFFTEGTIAATKFGPLATKDDIAARTGLRLKF
ncbi:MAG: hypothetical protein ABL893_04600 [Hyphomicrobium sp.]